MLRKLNKVSLKNRHSTIKSGGDLQEFTPNTAMNGDPGLSVIKEKGAVKGNRCTVYILADSKGTKKGNSSG